MPIGAMPKPSLLRNFTVNYSGENPPAATKNGSRPLPLILGLRQTEAWVTSQISLSSYALWLSTLTLIFIAPVYEEIVFRGCLFNAFQYWFNNKTWLSSVVVSVIFAIMHTQYVDLRTLLMLFLVSQVLIIARLKSNGLLMPIMLHIVMNGTVIALQMGAQTLLPDS